MRSWSRMGNWAAMLVVGLMSVLVVQNAGWTDERISWRTDFTGAKVEAAAAGKPLLVAVTATWCGPCRQMQQLTLADSRVVRAVDGGFIPVLVDVDAQASLVSGLGVTTFPTTLLVQPDGQVSHRWQGYQSAADFAAELERRRPSTSVRSSTPAREEFQPVSAIFPVNGDSFAFSGFCLASLLDDNKLRLGNPEITAEHRGQILCFTSEAHKRRFLGQPDRYWPVANGQCLVTSQEEDQKSPGDPRVGVKWRGKLWFFADRDRQQRFLRAPHRFSANQL